MAVANPVLPDLFAMGFNHLRYVGLHPKMIQLRLGSVLRISLYFVTTVTSLIMTAQQTLPCKDSLGDMMTNVSMCFGIIQVGILF